MDGFIKKVSTHELFPIIEELLAMDRQAIFTIKGRSMLPFIGDNRDQVLLEKRDFDELKRGDIILFKLLNGEYILHRIYKVESNKYLTIGDGNLYFDGWIESNQIIGVVSKIVRKGKEIDCNSRFWKFIFEIWIILLPIRGGMLKFYERLSKVKRKLLS